MQNYKKIVDMQSKGILKGLKTKKITRRHDG
jgi:hypothetical protein